MTVSELIERLKEMPQEAEVVNKSGLEIKIRPEYYGEGENQIALVRLS